MSLDTKILGDASGNGLEVDADGRALVVLPTTKEDAGYALMASMVHDGLAGQATPVVRNAEISINKRLRAGVDNLWFQDRFSYAAQWTGVWQSVLTTMTVTHTGGFINLNGGASVASAAVANYLTYKHFPCYNGAGLSVETIAILTQPPQTNNLVEIGLFQAATTAAPLDGVFFRLNAAGALAGVVNYGGAETEVAITPVPTDNEAHAWGIRIEQEATQFLIDGVLVATIPTPIGQNGPCQNMYNPVHFRVHNTGVPALAQTLRVGETRVFLRDIADGRSFAQTMGGMGGMGCQGHAGATQGTTALYTNSLVAGAGAAIANATAAAGFTGLGGQMTVTPTLAAGTDGILSSFLVPAGTAAIPGEALVITGVWIDGKVTAALTGGPVLYAMSLGIGNTAVSLATAEGAAAKASRRIPLGWQSFVVTAATGAKSDEGRLYVQFASPLVVNPGEYVQIAAKNLGTVTTVGTITFLIGFDAHWE